VPVVFVAVSVYVVVVVGLRTTDPLADVDANVPGVTVIPVAPAAAQFSVVLLPAMMDMGLAVKEVIVGAATSLVVGNFSVQPARLMKDGSSDSAPTTIHDGLYLLLPDCNA
jgi:hypothetical protein